MHKITPKSVGAAFHPPRVRTGIAGLDDILGGGWPRGHLYLVEGDPGAGKTTLALQFLLNGRENGENVVYFTLSESTEELRLAASSHGWSLDQVDIQELSPDPEELLPEAQYTVFHPAEIELAQTTRAILDHVEGKRPSRVVVDSLSEFRMLAREPLRYRRQILALKQFFAGRDCTVLLLDDRTADIRDLQLQSICHGVINLESISRDFGTQRRRISISKLRASTYRAGFHDYEIRAGGLEIFPRLIAAEHRQPVEDSNIRSGIPELDQLLGGGIDSGTSTLIAGPTGAGKSTIAAWYAFEAANRGQRAAIFAFDEGKGTLLTRLRALGLQVDNHTDGHLLSIDQIDPAELSPGQFVGRIREIVETEQLRILVIDSLNGLLNGMPGEQHLTLQLHELLCYLSQGGVSTFICLAQSGALGAAMQSPVDVSYLADTVILLRYFEFEGAVKKAVSVFKKRSGPHEDTIREFRISSSGIEIGRPLSNFRGVLTGAPEYLGRESSLLESDDGREPNN
ncbi:MAG: ATPase domain-containing protein [Candidatus Korobacteraceae bacterium]